MDFHTLSRKDLQALCKRNRIPANTTNVAMADALLALQSVEGLSEILGSVMVQSPKTSQKTIVRKSLVADQSSPLPRSRRVSAKPPIMDDEEKKEMSEAPSLVNTRRRTNKKEESKGIVGTTGGRRTRQTLKKEVGSGMVSTEVRRSTRRVKGIKMSPLSKEEDEEKDVQAEKLEVEAEKKSEEKGQSDDLKADADQLKSEEEKEAEIVVLESKGDGNVDENELEEEKVEELDPKEIVIAKATDLVEERMVENNEEDEAIAEEKQEDVVENTGGHVEEALLENKEDDKAINEEATQEETVDSKTEQDKAISEEMNILVDIKLNDSVVENIFDHVEETVVENEEEYGSIDEEAKQGEIMAFKSGKETAEIFIEEINISVDTEQEEDVLEIAAEVVDTLVENKGEDKPIDEAAKQEETVDEQGRIKITVDHVEEALVENKEEDEQGSIVHQVEGSTAENEEEKEAINEETMHEETAYFKTEQMSAVDHVEAILAENIGEVEAINEEAKREETVDFKTKQTSIVDHVEETLAENEGDESIFKEAKREETVDFKEIIVDHVEQTLVENREEDVAIDGSVMDNISGHVEEKVVENKNSAKIMAGELNVSVDTKCFVEENVGDSAASVEEEVVEDHIVSELALDEEHTLVNEDSPVKGLITSNCIMNDVVVKNEKFSIQELSDKTGTDASKNEIMELAENDLNFKVFSESNSNKENANLVCAQVKAKSNVVNYENLSLRKLKSAYREMVAMKSKGEEKRTALKAVNENCI